MQDIIPPRANRNGDPCPTWCVQDHSELLIAGKPEFGYMNGHVSDPMTAVLSPTTVKVRRSGLAGERATVDVDRVGAPLSLTAAEADMLAYILETLGLDTAQLVDELRQATVIARDDEGAARLAAVTADENGEHPGDVEAAAGSLPWAMSADGSQWTATLPDGGTAMIKRLDDGASFLPTVDTPGLGFATGPVCAGVLGAASWVWDFAGLRGK